MLYLFIILFLSLKLIKTLKTFEDTQEQKFSRSIKTLKIAQIRLIFSFKFLMIYSTTNSKHH